MLEMFQRTPYRQRRRTLRPHPRPSIGIQIGGPAAAGDAGRGARGPAVLPELAEFFPDFAARAGPVVADVVAEFSHVPAQVEFVLLEPGDVEFLARGAAFELAGDVFLVVSHDSRDLYLLEVV